MFAQAYRINNFFAKFNLLPFRHGKFFYQALLIILGGAVLFLIVLIKAKGSVDFYAGPLIFTYTIFITVFQLSRMTGAMFYSLSANKIISDNSGDYEPIVTFLIPCKNEEDSIVKTVSKCFEADYPKDKKEVIVINDGSTDNTAMLLRNLEDVYDNLIVVHWEKNKGKRHAMHKGFKMARGEIVIQIDSDSYIKPETFKNLIKYFENQEIGAVCVHTDPENADKNLMTKMQAAYYFVSFRILKAAESVFMSVFCCSGCCSAYRKDVVLPIIDEWVNETFLGLPVTWGDDRALTNWVLKRNYKTIYTDKAKAYTVCPDNLRTFLKQQVRWKKGWFVNSIFASRFIAKKDPFVSFTYFFPLIMVTMITPFIATKALIYNPVFKGVVPLLYIAGIFLIACLFVIYYRYIDRSNKYWPFVFVWSAINMIFLSFVLVYALLTIQNRRWGTR